MASKKKFYVVWRGRQTGIFTTWAECETQVKGFAGAQYKSFDTRAEAEASYQRPYESSISKSDSPKVRPLLSSGAIYPSYSVDAACSGNPGDLEYRCIDHQTGKEVFRRGIFPDGTNNIGEFLAIVEALALFKKDNITLPLYSDSKIAIGWVKAKTCRTTLAQTKRNAELFELISRAENWLEQNQYTTKIIKWETRLWGEIPADFGRK